VHFEIDLYDSQVVSLLNRVIAITGPEPWTKKFAVLQHQLKENEYLREFQTGRHGIELTLGNLLSEQQRTGTFPLAVQQARQYHLYAFSASLVEDDRRGVRCGVHDCTHRHGRIRASSRNTFLMNSFTRYFWAGGGVANAGCCFVEVGVLRFVEVGVVDGSTGMLSSEAVTSTAYTSREATATLVGRPSSTLLVKSSWPEYVI